jgi:hypothetical protein
MASKKVLGGIAALVGATAAQAAPVTVSSTVTLGNLLQGGAQQNLQFNLNGLLAQQGVQGGDVISGVLTVYGLSNPSYQDSTDPYGGYYLTGLSSHTASQSYTYYTSYSYSCGFWGWSTCTGYTPHTGYYNYQVQDEVWTHERTKHHIDNVADRMEVTAGGNTASATASTVQNYVNPYGGSTYEYVSGSWQQGWDTYYARERDHYQSISGPLKVTLDLDALALSDLWGDGILNISISAALGQFIVSEARLEATAEAVPLPGSLALAAIGMAAMAGSRRRRRKA